MTGRCLIGQTRLPTRHQRRISDLVFPAGVLRQPEHVGTGRALNWVERGQPLTHGAVLRGGRVTLPWAPGGRVERVGSATASFLHLFRRPAKNADQRIAQQFCPVAPSVFGSAHGFNNEGTNARKAVNYCQGFGNVCRA